MDKYKIKATVSFYIDIPSIERIEPEHTPEPYTREEWYEQLMSNEVNEKLGWPIGGVDFWEFEKIED